MSDTDVCYCGHVEDEHGRNEVGHPAQCEVKDCECFYFERDDEEDDDDNA